MSGLYFKYGTMNSSKTANLLMIKHNYEEQNISVIILKPCIDTRDEDKIEDGNGVDRVIGIMLPNGTQADIEDSIEVCKYLGIENYTISIKPMIDESYRALKHCNIELTDQCRQNIAPRERTKMIRAVCQCKNGRMINTCNYSEDYVGYFTVGGDGEGDVAPLGKFTKSEVVEIGHYLGLPKNLVDKTPSDGLCGKSDEDNLGFTYQALDNYIRLGTSGDTKIDTLIRAKHDANVFKLEPTKSFDVIL